MLKLYFLAALAVLVTVNAVQYKSDRASFMEWCTTHKRDYCAKYASAGAGASGSMSRLDVLAERMAIWQKNLAMVNAHNALADAGKETFWMGMNDFSDMTNEEYRARISRPRTLKAANTASHTFNHAMHAKTVPPTDFDWRTEGIVPPVKNQGECGSCWSFSAAAAMEGAFNKKNAKSIPSVCAPTKCGTVDCCSFSEQELVECVLGGADNCNRGGEMHDGILWVAGNKGMYNTEQQYPYISGNGRDTHKCSPKPNPVATGITGYTNVTSGDESALLTAVYTQSTISVGIDASAMAFQLYSHGIYNHPACKNSFDELDHGVSVVGYGVGTPSLVAAANMNVTAKSPAAEGTYWMVRNSWGPSWGMKGYIAMSRNANNQCGIATDATFPNL